MESRVIAPPWASSARGSTSAAAATSRLAWPSISCANRATIVVGVMSTEPSLELRHLVALVTVGSERSFGRAADRLGYTRVGRQPADRRARAERRPQARRTPRRAPPGRADRGGCAPSRATPRTSFRASSWPRPRWPRSPGAAPGSLRVGIYESIGVRLLPGIVRRLSEGSPGLELEAIEARNDGEQLERLAGGELDIAFTVVPLDDERFETLELRDDPFCLLVAVRLRARPPGRRRARGARRARARELPLVPVRALRRGVPGGARGRALAVLPLGRQRRSSRPSSPVGRAAR